MVGQSAARLAEGGLGMTPQRALDVFCSMQLTRIKAGLANHRDSAVLLLRTHDLRVTPIPQHAASFEVLRGLGKSPRVWRDRRLEQHRQRRRA